MADLSQLSEESRHKLPPISPRTKATDAGGNVRRSPRKKKKAVSTQNLDNDEEKGSNSTEKRRRPKPKNIGENDHDKTQSADESTIKKKKRKQVKESGADTEATSESTNTVKKRKTPRPKQDVTGSKTSLLSKEEEGTKTKVKRKKKKKVVKERDEGDYTDSGLAADLTSIEDDVIPLDEDDNTQEEVQHPNAVITLKSQATSKIFVETDSGFKGQNKSKLAKRLAEERQSKPTDLQDNNAVTSIEYALKTHHVLQTFFLFCHGLTAGIALWHVVTVYILSYHSVEDFLIHYQPLALPTQSLFYILLVCCTISTFDRNDISYPTKQSIRQAVTLQSGAVSVVFYIIALVFSLVLAAGADRMHLYYINPDLWTDSQAATDEVNLWRSLNTVRGVFIILGWFVLSLTPNTDRLSENLNNKDDPLGNSVEMLSASSA